tara:strand:+ start:326 stop:1693 length:1368 start_codon:yes stop_codon:yes gene_type:complete
MNNYKKKYLKYKKKYLQTKNIYGGMEPGYEWNPKGYFENLGPDLSKYIDSETKWDEEMYEEWPETQEWRLTEIKQEDVFNDLKKKELCNTFVFGYTYTENTEQLLESLKKDEEPYAEIIFTTPHHKDSGGSKPPEEVNNQKRTLIKKTINGISNKKIINMHLLNAQWEDTKYFGDSNEERNLVLGSSQANSNHKYYESKITTLANNCNKWNTYIREKNIGTDMNKIAVQTSTYVPNQFLYDENNKPYSNKGFILKIRLIQINNDGSLIPLNPQDVVNEWDRVGGWHNADRKENPAILLEADYELFNKYGMYVMINWPNPTIQILLLPESEESEESEYENDGYDDDTPCEICHKSDPKNFFFCNNCDKGFHSKCLNLSKIPEGDWFCSDCKDQIDLDEAIEQSKIYEEERKKQKQMDETIENIVNMGFSREKVENAFVKLKGNTEATINYLLNNSY